MRELISHPTSKGGPILLRDHLKKVGNLCVSFLRSYSLNLSFPQEELIKAGFIAGVCHDFGKAKEQFQRYIWGEGRRINQDHSLISSLFTFLVAEELFKDKKGPVKLLPFACAYAVNRHHGILVNLEEAFAADSLNEEFKIAKGSLDERIWGFRFDLAELNFPLEFQNYREKFLSCSINSIVDRIKKDFAEPLDYLASKHQAEDSWLMDLYFALLLIISSLTEADQASVVGMPAVQISGQISPETVKEFAFSQPQAPPTFQRLREKAWKEIENFRQQDLSFRLNLPTGMGKTLIGLYLAGCLSKREEGQIIYALPYLSIIEQTIQVCYALFPPNSIIQHHSLSFPQKKHEEELNFEQARLCLESWNANLIVTTFDQLFYSFLSPERSFIQRFFRLPGSVLILDEVQTLPARLIPAIQTMLQKISEKLKTRILYMTATHPPFLKRAQPVLYNDGHYFQNLNRTRLLLDIKQSLPFSEYLNSLEGWLKQKRNKNILFVANTIRSSLKLWDRLFTLKENEDLEDMEIFYLSGNVVPIHRLKRVQQIKLDTELHPWLVIVSTQCVEAGVDIDMDQIVRDFAPWDSIMQVCGRANRFGKREEAFIYIYRWLDDFSDNAKEFHRYIYDPILVETTLDVLRNYSEVKEADFLEIQNQYAERLEERLGKEETKELLKNALAWQFEELDFRKLFRGIEGWKVSLFCVADEVAERLKDIGILFWNAKDIDETLKALRALWSKSTLYEPLVHFLRITPEEVQGFIDDLEKDDKRSVRYQLPRLLRPMFQAYTVSLPVRSLESLKEKMGQICEGFPYIPREYYDPVRGFSPEKDDKLLSNII